MWEKLNESYKSNSEFEQAVIRGDLDLVKQAIEQGADKDYSSNERSMIYIASFNKSWGIVDYLLDEGANVNTANSFHNRLIHQVAENGSVQLLSKVIAAGAIINCRDLDKETPFLSAVKKNRHDVVDYMLDLIGVDITSMDSEGKTTLHYCAEKGYKDMFMKLWYQGVDIAILDRKGNSAIDYIQDQDWKDELPELEKEVIEVKQLKEAQQEAQAAADTAVVKRDTLKASGISSIKRRLPKPTPN